jgi:hypothetical protein
MALSSIVGGMVAAAQSPRPRPPPFQTPSADNRSQVIPQPAGARVMVAEGFNVTITLDGPSIPGICKTG